MEMYNEFLQTGIPDCLNRHNPLIFRKKDVECKIYMGTDCDGKFITLYQPDNSENDDYDDRKDHFYMFPKDARKNKQTYALTVTCAIQVEVTINNKTTTLPLYSMVLGTIPLMVKSNECIMFDTNIDDMDNGGYFIIKGEDKTIPIEMLQQVFEETYLQNMQKSIFPRIAKYHKQQSKYSGENFPKIFIDNHDYIFKCKNTMRRKFHILFSEFGQPRVS